MDDKTVGVRELRDRATQIIREVRENKTDYVVTVHGRPVAVIRPFTADEEERIRLARADAHLAEVSRLANEVAASWVSEQSGVDLIADQRRG